MSFHSETYADRSNDQGGIVGRGQDQEQQVQLLALRAGSRLDQKRRRPRAVRSDRFFIGFLRVAFGVGAVSIAQRAFLALLGDRIF